MFCFDNNQSKFLLKKTSARLQGWWDVSENQIISSHTDTPAHYDNYIHKKGNIQLNSPTL